MKLHHKLMIVCIVTIVIPISSLTYLFVDHEQRYMLRNMGDSYQSVLNQLNTGIQFNLRFYESIADNIMLSPAVQNGLENPQEYIQKGLYMMNKEISDSIRYVDAYQAAEIENVQIYSLTSDSLSDGQYWFPISRLKQEVDEQNLTDSKIWTFDYEKDSHKYFYTFIRPIFSLNDFQKIGYIRLVIKIPSIVTSSQLSQQDDSKEKVFIVKTDGTYLFHSSQDQMGRKAAPEIMKMLNNGPLPEHERLIQLDGGSYYLWYQNVSIQGWTSILLVPKSSIDGKISEIRNMLLLFSGLSIFFFTVISYFLIRRLTFGIRTLHYKVIRLGKGLFYPSGEVKGGNDEVSVLSRSFDKMIVRLNKLIQENYIQKLNEKELELSFLQAQINPHFLYNTLDAIKNEIDMNEKETAVQMVVALADLFRISVSKGKHIILWEEELYHAQCYLQIHRTRFGHKYDVVWDIDPAVRSLYTLKIILQPVLENAIQHGFKHKKNDGLIHIAGKCQDDTVVFTVRDNGIGIQESKRSELMGDHHHHTDKKTGVGLQNINQRIGLYFGKPYGVTFSADLSAGTEVKILLPALKGDRLCIDY